MCLDTPVVLSSGPVPSFCGQPRAVKTTDAARGGQPEYHRLLAGAPSPGPSPALVTHCGGLNICVPLQIHTVNPNPNVAVLERSLWR